MSRNSKAIISTSLGNILEWYDFCLYGSLAAIFAHQFFANKSFFISLIVTFGVFASGFLMRPLGGILYGHIGDTVGRRKALLSSIALIAIPTIAMGLLPTEAYIGILAPCMVMLIRLLQGLAVGGEFGGNMSYLAEIAPTNHRGLYGSLSMFGVLAGVVLGSLVITGLSHLLSITQFESFGWRIAFLFSGIIAYLVFRLRRNMNESQHYNNLASQKKRGTTPLYECLISYKIPLLKAFGLSIFTGVSFWILIIYTVTYMGQILNIPAQQSYLINFVMAVITMFLIPVAGWVSDRIGRKKVLLVVSCLFMLLSYPLNPIVITTAGTPIFYLIQALLCVLLAFYLGPVPALLAELIPTSIRFTGLSLAYNLALALFGGTAPLLITYLIEKHHTPYAPGIVLTIAAAIAFITLLSIKEKRDTNCY